jgi:hypothetical protein
MGRLEGRILNLATLVGYFKPMLTENAEHIDSA